MKFPTPRILNLALPAAATLLLASCVSDGPRGGYHRGPGGGGYVTYATLPPNYAGDSYYYNNRYYAGGRYETGRYSYGGRSYGNRYYHNGQYIYGGSYRQYPVAHTVQPRGPRPSGSGYVTYTTLPPNFGGSAYYYNNRYYAGGRYETGRYTNQGRTYTGRYYHNGQYLYGGSHRQNVAQPVNRKQVQQKQNQQKRQRRSGY